MVIIIILVLAVCGLSVGLATFSSVLTISSSATVLPGSEEYKFTIYGITDDFDTVVDNINAGHDLFEYVSTVYSVPSVVEGAVASNATIDNNAFTIKDIDVTMYPNSDL